jgi:hypothetical protein
MHEAFCLVLFSLQNNLAPEIERARLRHFVGARLIDWRVGWDRVRGNQLICQHISFDLFAADIGQHLAIDLDTRAEHLAAFLNHLLGDD